MSRQVSPSIGRLYGLARVTRVWGVARATVYRHRRPAAPRSCRPGPIGPMPDAALIESIRAVLAGSGFSGEGYRKLDRAAIKGPGSASPVFARPAAACCG